ncbi:FtsX-like permease family protein [Azospirillum sp. sgz302134]
MRIAPRWRKLLRDADAVQGRILMAIAAIAIGVYAVTAIAAAGSILLREMTRNYAATNPASALIDLGSVDPALVEAVRRDPVVAAAEATAIVTARAARGPDEWVRLLLFVIPDFETLSVNTVFPQHGAWPPPPGTILLEREALTFLGATVGGSVTVQTPTGSKQAVTVSGTVHDPSLAPAWQEQTAYGYLTPDTLAALGGPPTPDTLKVVVRDASDQTRVDAAATALARTLRAQGLTIHQIRIPPTGRHPHQTQMTAVLAMFLIFALLAQALAASLTASMIDGLLAQQVRQIAVMKAIGARTGQVAGLYLTAILAMAVVAVAVGLPLGLYSGGRIAGVVAALLNFNIASAEVPVWLILAVGACGILIPVAFAFVPVGKAARITVREALSDQGIARGTGTADRIIGALTRLSGTWLSGIDRTLLLAIRNAFRRRGRLALTLLLLSAAGGMFLASANVQKAWDAYIAASAQDRDYDLELRIDRPVPTADLLAMAAEVPGVVTVEPWSVTAAAPARADGLTVVRTYPDGGHANLEFRSLPAADRLSHLVLLDGGVPNDAWAAAGDDGAILINQSAQILLGHPKAGDTIALTVEGRTASYRIAGVVRQIVTPPAVYAPASAYQAATGTQGRTDAMRLVTDRHEAAAVDGIANTVEARLGEAGIRVLRSLSEAQFDRAVGDHVKVLVVLLVIMAVLMAVVGLLGLASAQGSSVAERTRELGVMRAIGGTTPVIVRNVIAEGVVIGLISVVPALLLALPLAAGIGRLVGTLSFGLPLPLTLSMPALELWLGIVLFGAVLASLVPARHAAKLTIRETLAYA